MYRVLILVPGLALAGCGEPVDSAGSGGSSGSSSPGTGGEELSITIISPADGAVVMEGDVVRLQVGAPDGLDGASWSLRGDASWSAEGSPVEVSDLPVGELVLEVEAWSGQASASASVALTVEERVPISYAGDLDAWAELVSPLWSADGPCVGPVDFVREVDDTLSGTGGCTADLDGYEQPVDFVIDGVIEGGAVSGTMRSELSEEAIEFSGGVDADGLITCAFDKTWTEGDGSLRIWGTLAASPL